jgi:4-carboxymuconolactone decarboxylase
VTRGPVTETPQVSEAPELLRKLSAGDEGVLRAVMAPTRCCGSAEQPLERCLDRRTESLVRLGALISLNAPVQSLRWAVDLAATAGVDDETIVDVLIAVAVVAGSAQAVASAPWLALALGLDVESVEPTRQTRLLPE